MDLPEASTHSFIVKIWVEDAGDEAENALWRGHITHVPSGTRRYLKDLGDIADFILPYLDALGVRPSRWVRARRWLRTRRFFRAVRDRNGRRDDSPH